LHKTSKKEAFRMLFSPIKTMEVNCMNPVVTEAQGCDKNTDEEIA
jgi:hypothetical protein